MTTLVSLTERVWRISRIDERVYEKDYERPFHLLRHVLIRTKSQGGREQISTNFRYTLGLNVFGSVAGPEEPRTELVEIFWLMRGPKIV